MLRHYDDARRDLPAGGYDPRRLVSPGLTPGLCSSHASSSLTVLTKLPADRGYDQSEPTASITGLAPGSCANKGVQGVSWNQDYDDRPSSDRSRQAGCADAAAGAAVAGRVLDRGFSQTSPRITPLRPCLPAARRGEGFRSFRRLWAEAVRGDPSARPMPRIEFEHNMVIVAAMGSRPSTGFGITIDSVVVRGPSMEVHVVLSSPGSLCIQGMALTSPVDIVEVPTSVRVVLFRDREVTVECKMP